MLTSPTDHGRSPTSSSAPTASTPPWRRYVTDRARRGSRECAPAAPSYRHTERPRSRAARPRRCGSAPTATWSTTRSPREAQINIVAFGPGRRLDDGIVAAHGTDRGVRAPSSPGGIRDCGSCSRAAEGTGPVGPARPGSAAPWSTARSPCSAMPRIRCSRSSPRAPRRPMEDAAALAGCLADRPDDPPARCAATRTLRRPRATRVQQTSRGRADEQPPARRAGAAGPRRVVADADPLVANGWIYGHDAELVP